MIALHLTPWRQIRHWSARFRPTVVARLAALTEVWESRLRSLGDEPFRQQSLALRYRAQGGTSLRALLPEGFALVREAARRALGQRHYSVQLHGGVGMFLGAVAEMQTGEGKTLTMTLPAFVHALPGLGVHVATANDYLAQRDAELMRPIYELLGMRVGVIEAKTQKAERQRAYDCDLTYGTAKEFGFDFLRDRMSSRGGGVQRMRSDESTCPSLFGGIGQTRDDGSVQRGLHCALLDEADSILIDEARTPLVVSTLASQTLAQQQAIYRWAAEVARGLSADEDWCLDCGSRAVQLTATGRRRVRDAGGVAALNGVSARELWEQVQRAVTAKVRFQRDRHYLVRGDEVVIIDEFSGRPAEGRRWRDGLQQAIEAREGLPISAPVGDAARVTLQDYFLRYRFLSGMTGTAGSSAAEFRQIYRLPIRVVPTHRTSRRKTLSPRVFASSEAKWRAIADEVREVLRVGRPVLIGTRSIDKSEQLSHVLQAAGISHAVLNARHLAREAEIVAATGQSACVTVATNMAGRGTDIQLAPEVQERGGLHVIGTELHESARIDRQLAGRCGRQGDPGSFRQYLALDDDILATAFGAEWARDFRAGLSNSKRLERYVSVFHRAQKRVERKQMRDRKRLMHIERERRRWQEPMGEDPYLDGAM